MRATFEEKTYEAYFNCELDRLTTVFFPPGQVQEGYLGFDTTAYSVNRLLWRKLGYSYWNPTHFIGAHLRNIADRLEAYLRQVIENVPTLKVNLVFQYKKPEFIALSTGKEWAHWAQPYYRYNIYAEQQKLLMEIDTHFGGDVFVSYASPALYKLEDLIQAFLDKEIIEQSNFRKARELDPHHRNTYCQSGTYSIGCSEPDRLNNFNLLNELEILSANNSRSQKSNAQFIIDFRRRIVSIASEDGAIGKAFLMLNAQYSELEKFELLYSFLILKNFRTVTGTQWLIKY